MKALVIGGTGTLGTELLPLIHEDFERVRVLSRNDHKQLETAAKLKLPNVDWLVGDVRDEERVMEAVKGCHVVFHLAAMKHVDKCEYDPREAILTNIIGTMNVVRACKERGVETAIFTSSDKAVEPLNLYGATKLVGEKYWIAGNIGNHRCRFNAVRYGNVLGSNGSAYQRWKSGESNSVTVPEMTRFYFSPKDAARFVHRAMFSTERGVIYIPKMKAASTEDLWKASRDDEPEITGIRPGEKLHECLISANEVEWTTETEHKYIRFPTHEMFPVKHEGTKVKKPIYSNTVERLTQEEIKELCSKSV